ncbi:DUF4350 domain-containing protein [Neobacillus sp. 114]|uniref:DUF4350 domain-containing protein n=1 Tax=Neobacillus sp. 114 TaxID=3048535 RepID=UPI0024C2D9D7|nr:DUF4350 domain-containing protein [Neobacillus sp. 114]
MHKARKGWLWLFILVTVFVLFNYFTFTPNPKVYPNYVTESPSPTGTKGFYTYLKKEMSAKSWNHSPSLLPKNKEQQLLIMVEPRNFTEKEEIAAYNDFMKAGNSVLLLARDPDSLFDLKTKRIEEDLPPSETWKIYGKEGKAQKAEVLSLVRLQPHNGEDTLLHDKYGPVALKRAVGKGQLIVAITPEWITNGKILKNDHLPLLVSLVNESHSKTVFFDEYVHGEQTTSTFLSAFPKWFLLLMLQGILIAFIWLWNKGKRFGPIVVPREEMVRFSDEGIRAISAWYLRGRRYQDSLLIQADYLKQLLQERWQVPYHKEWQDILGYLERKWTGIQTNEIHLFLQELAMILDKNKITKQEYLLWSKKLDQLQKEVEEG